MLIPIRTEYRMSIRPYVNYGLVVANLALFLLGYNGTDERFAATHSFFLDPDFPKLYQFLSSVFLHGSLWHLLGNMIFL